MPAHNKASLQSVYDKTTTLINDLRLHHLLVLTPFELTRIIDVKKSLGENDKTNPREIEEWALTLERKILSFSQSIEILEIYPNLIDYLQEKREDITQSTKLRFDSLILFVYEGHILKLSSIIDQLLIIISLSCRLGFKEKDVSPRLVFSNRNTKGLKFVEDFKNLIFTHYAEGKDKPNLRDKRNMIIHRGEKTSPDIYLAAAAHATSSTEGSSDKSNVKWEQIIWNEVTNIVYEILQNIIQVIEPLPDIMDGILKQIRLVAEKENLFSDQKDIENGH